MGDIWNIIPTTTGDEPIYIITMSHGRVATASVDGKDLFTMLAHSFEQVASRMVEAGCANGVVTCIHGDMPRQYETLYRLADVAPARTKAEKAYLWEPPDAS
jgi:hypothetical protein